MADEPGAETFAAHINSTFRVVEARAPALGLQLVEVTLLGHRPSAPRPDPFVLTFAGAADRALEQQIHCLAHPVLGELEIFLVPIGHGRDGRLQYEAVFN